LYADSEDAIENHFIVVFHKNTPKEAVELHSQKIRGSMYIEIGSFQALKAVLSQSELKRIQSSSDVSYIEQDQNISAFEVMEEESCVTQNFAVWGLDRISDEELNLDDIYTYSSSAGEGVSAYVLDSGIYATHEDFSGRVELGYNFIDNNTNAMDCAGHGTHVAGTIGSDTYGVAKKVHLVAVKVLDCGGRGAWSLVLLAVQFIIQHHKEHPSPAVVNMSLGGRKSTALADAISEAISLGVNFAVAAGNSNMDACTVTPANLPGVISSGATTVEDESGTEIDARTTFSNFGGCLSIFAPGMMITSTYIGESNQEIKTMSGTSMASPHIAGAVALYLGKNPNKSPEEVKTAILQNAVQGLINFHCEATNYPEVCGKSPNLLLHTPC